MRVLARGAIPVLLLSLEMTLWFFFPAILGYEGAGILVEVAEGVGEILSQMSTGTL